MKSLNHTGYRIKQRREELGFTTYKLAKLADVNQSTISRYETGQTSKLTPKMVEKLAIALSTTPAYIMGWVNVPEAYEDEEDSMLINESIQLLRSLSKEKKREVYHLIKDISSK
ncbi:MULTISPECIES: helix-turn-helix domain-containing protein [Mammaliicoccus]|uniref:helix-turn-helix domain-containing protein n=1 Tax=Mammaliicoccus TaxID=2803850 RepID=UPI001D67FCC6|nr:helix-turn-helix transcriptional regulator [Mammaliicoccus lentus]MCD2522139.1 helix-turn-helix transcriptional regulator [Mammaliicoccus lentus]MCR1871879.1 helix-turn-helix transcriptional regulator [Mammaliicoccus lentus]MEB8090872.1 helix-turn-helix transcriptional regulator [Mammaliicoccus lentus]WHI54745.1 helix-turn-helix transcriptional regulator [Mammaliicoccus lentus]WHI57268.1 helix-turn-helix transcriptional regulator [Mammaliicoccus lentus]